MSDDDVILICGRVSTLSASEVAPIAFLAYCTNCREKVYVSKTSLPMIAKHGAKLRIVCTLCGDEEMRNDDDVQIEPLTREQAAEIAVVLARESVRRN